MSSGVRCAETTFNSWGIPKSLRIFAASFMVSKSEILPMMMPTLGRFPLPALAPCAELEVFFRAALAMLSLSHVYGCPLTISGLFVLLVDIGIDAGAGRQGILV